MMSLIRWRATLTCPGDPDTVTCLGSLPVSVLSTSTDAPVSLRKEMMVAPALPINAPTRRRGHHTISVTSSAPMAGRELMFQPF